MNIQKLSVGFLSWYFLRQPVRVWRQYREYAGACNQMCSFVFLAKTLLRPWKSISDRYPKNGLAIGQMFQVLTLNVTARVVGMCIRIGAILFGICIQACLIAFFAFYLAIWITYPILVILSVPYLSSQIL